MTTPVITEVTTDAAAGAPVDGSESRRKHPAATHREQVTAGRVLEGEKASEQAREHQNRHDRGHPRSDVLGGEREQHFCGGRERHLGHRRQFDGLFDDSGGAHSGDHREGGQGEEHRDHDDREVGGARHDLLRVAGLLAVDRGRFEADERGEGEGEGDAGGTRESSRDDRRRVERRPEVDAFWSTVREDDDGRDHESREFEKHEATEHLRSDIHAQKREHGDERPGDERPGPPREDANLAGHDGAEESEDGELDCHVGEDRDEGGGDAGMATETAADVGEERAGVGDPLAHRGVPDAEEQQGDADDEVGARGSCAVAEHDGHRNCTGHADERGGGGDDEEDDADGAESALVERGVGVRFGSGGVLGECHCDTPR
jgi:hypothetical protein